ncbi:MAG: hypothetical protein ACI90V_013822 [Bacillariaceae sp.]
MFRKIHEGARGGHLEVVKYLVENGANINAVTGSGIGGGGSALYLAKQKFDADHPVVAFLESIGAIETGPDL